MFGINKLMVCKTSTTYASDSLNHEIWVFHLDAVNSKYNFKKISYPTPSLGGGGYEGFDHFSSFL